MAQASWIHHWYDAAWWCAWPALWPRTVHCVQEPDTWAWACAADASWISAVGLDCGDAPFLCPTTTGCTALFDLTPAVDDARTALFLSGAAAVALVGIGLALGCRGPPRKAGKKRK